MCIHLNKKKCKKEPIAKFKKNNKQQHKEYILSIKENNCIIVHALIVH